MICRDVVERVTDYLEGALGRRERAALEAHVAGCEGCTRYLEQMRRTIAALRVLPGERLSPGARDELLGVFRAWREGRA